ncbi:uncharacterized protein BO80DRAFT_437280 [Aspergillus ibericus CBS 121593]|uniref:Uncharacterized protein n=1 Tax=Aspergillus ibericus CBS 121593 TaxID=1448316 RepID=A0A395GRX8_9EURO|nr:hypothetical protein BO80DRAFT_437280 [Aspergillus ibericus CBS 121593]RAK98189.1 hypothetical protein BO80DRAFT_437280 [Aspergillus ibericus CBS 121593]
MRHECCSQMDNRIRALYCLPWSYEELQEYQEVCTPYRCHTHVEFMQGEYQLTEPEDRWSWNTTNTQRTQQAQYHKMGQAPSTTSENERTEGNAAEEADHVNAEEELNHGVGSLIRYRLVRLSAIRKWTRWKRYQDLEPADYVEYYPIRLELDLGAAFINPETGSEEQLNVDANDAEGKTRRKMYFISHRWLTQVHPDPDGTQLRRVQQLPPRPLGHDSSSIGDAGSSSTSTVAEATDPSAQHDPASNILIFYDFCSLPQEPRTAEENDTFKLGILGLNNFLYYTRVVILDDHDYMSRSWCLMEYFISSFKGSLILDEKRDDRMHSLHQLAVIPNRRVREARSATAETEAIRASKMGEIAMSFFAESFQNSSVTKGTDRGAIEAVFKRFIQDNIRAWRHEADVGWKPTWLEEDQVDRILRGERLRLIQLPETNLPAPEMPAEIESVVPQAAYDNEHDALEPFWVIMRILRGVNAFTRYLLLNDPVSKKDDDMLKKTNMM